MKRGQSDTVQLQRKTCRGKRLILMYSLISSMVECLDCGKNFDSKKGRNVHIGQTSCEYPELSQKQKQITTGLLMGDAWLNGCFMAIDNTNFEFIEWLEDELEIVHGKTALRKMDDPNHNDQKRMRLQTHSWFEQLRSWYDGGKKKFPEDLELTPMILKVWYACDGSLVEGNRSDYYEARISASNEREGNLEGLFEDTPLNPTVYRNTNVEIVFGANEREAFFEWVGEPVPGFEYKWRTN